MAKKIIVGNKKSYMLDRYTGDGYRIINDARQIRAEEKKGKNKLKEKWKLIESWKSFYSQEEIIKFINENIDKKWVPDFLREGYEK